MAADETTRSLLTIAGSAPSGGAGIAADLHTFRDHGFHGLHVLTAVIDQDTVEVGGVHPVDPELLHAALSRTLRTGRPLAIKIGLLCDRSQVEAVVGRAQEEARAGAFWRVIPLRLSCCARSTRSCGLVPPLLGLPINCF